jgi:uncharacterized membrane protein
MESTVDLVKDKAQEAANTLTDAQNVGNAERIISLAAGVILTVAGLRKKETMLGKGMSFIGGLLITRGTTGFCPLNKAIGRNSLLTEAVA